MKNLLIVALLLSNFLLINCSTNDKYEIVYFSNLNGNVEACDCSEIRLGGLHHIKKIIDNLRSENKNLVVVDGGDTFNTYSFIELDSAVYESYKLIKPDIWVPAEQEFIEGFDFFNNVINQVPSTYITGNVQYKNLHTIYQKEYSYKYRKITFTSFIQPKLFQTELRENYVVNDFGRIKKISEELGPGNFDILIFHGDEIEFEKQKDLIQKFDLVLSAHQQSDEFDLESDPPVIGGGADGEFLAHIILQENSSGFKINASKINVEQDENPDKEISEIISEYRHKIGLND